MIQQFFECCQLIYDGREANAIRGASSNGLEEPFPQRRRLGRRSGTANTVGLQRRASLRRLGPSCPGERFERADVRCNVGNSTIVVEYDSGGIATHNLVKYWAYLRGRNVEQPLVCHYSLPLLELGDLRIVPRSLGLGRKSHDARIQPLRFDSPPDSSIIGMLIL